MTTNIIKAYTRYDPRLAPAPPQYEELLRESLTPEWAFGQANELSKNFKEAAYGYGYDLYRVRDGKVYRNDQFQPDLAPSDLTSSNSPYKLTPSGQYINPDEWRPERTWKSTGNQYAFGYGYTAAVSGRPATPFETVQHGTPARSIRTTFYSLGYERGLADLDTQAAQKQKAEQLRFEQSARREEVAFMSDYQGFKEAASTYEALFEAYSSAVSKADEAAGEALRQQRDWRDAALRNRGIKPPPRLNAQNRSPAAEKDFRTYSDIALNSIWSQDFENSLIQSASAARQYQEMERVRQNSVDRSLPFSEGYKNRLSEMFSWTPEQRSRLPEYNIELPEGKKGNGNFSPFISRRTGGGASSVGTGEDETLANATVLG